MVREPETQSRSAAVLYETPAFREACFQAARAHFGIGETPVEQRLVPIILVLSKEHFSVSRLKPYLFVCPLCRFTQTHFRSGLMQKHIAGCTSRVHDGETAEIDEEVDELPPDEGSLPAEDEEPEDAELVCWDCFKAFRSEAHMNVHRQTNPRCAPAEAEEISVKSQKPMQEMYVIWDTEATAARGSDQLVTMIQFAPSRKLWEL